MSGIFISYRRSGASTIAYRLADDLKRTFGNQSIFLDVESIDPGIPFAQAIQQSLNQCTVALIIIGPQWLSMSDGEGHRRLDNPEDWVRQEVRLALESELRVIPVLVQDAKMPDKHDLPEEIQGLCALQAFSIINSQTHWSFDVERLQTKIAQIDKKLIPNKPDPSSKPVPEKANSYSVKAIVGLAIGVILWLYFGTEGGWLDIEEASGALVFLTGAIALSVYGLIDIRAGKTKGIGIAIGGIVVSVLMFLATLGDMSSIAEENSLDTVQQAIWNQQQQPAVIEATPPPVQKIQPQKIQPAKPVIVNISGWWTTPQGAKYQMVQNGNQVSFVEYNIFNAAIGEGSGTISGSTYRFDYYNSLMGTSGKGIGSINGNAMAVDFSDQFNNRVSFSLFRQ